MHSKNQKIETDLSAIIERLLNADIKFILVGGLATVIQGAPVTTIDVDIVPLRTEENLSRLFTFLNSIEAIYRRPDDKIIKPKENDLSDMGHALFSTSIGPVDVLSFIENNQTYEDLIKHTQEIEFRGNVLHVLDIEKIIELKETSNDPKDLQRLPLLRETLRQLKDD